MEYRIKEPFTTEKFADLTAGGYIQMAITYNADNIC
jgi:hypothetical protein